MKCLVVCVHSVARCKHTDRLEQAAIVAVGREAGRDTARSMPDYRKQQAFDAIWLGTAVQVKGNVLYSGSGSHSHRVGSDKGITAHACEFEASPQNGATATAVAAAVAAARADDHRAAARSFLCLHL